MTQGEARERAVRKHYEAALINLVKAANRGDREKYDQAARRVIIAAHTLRRVLAEHHERRQLAKALDLWKPKKRKS